jgi:hypothetical protein
MFQRFIFAAILIIGVGFNAGQVQGDEGMYPMSELENLDLEAAGLEIDPASIYNPEELSLVDGICKIGGCTGSFVSEQGLMLTNHHCAFRAIRDASTTSHDYLAEGFSAVTMADEVPAIGYTVRITESYQDVTTEVLAAIKDGMAPAERTKAIEKVMKEISLHHEGINPGKRAEVNEMFLGKNYVLFLYTYLKDVRLVYAPPQGVGNFGGEADNWMWPRHSGDFSFMRAYVGPDGEPAEYSENNVPYKPAKVLEVSRDGVQDGDFVFIFGYPGTTYRHRSSHFLSHLTELYMPMVVDWYGWQIKNLEALAKGDRERELRLAARVKGLQNTYKNFRGKLQGVARLGLLAQKQAEERRLQDFIEADPNLDAKYGKVLEGLDAYYKERSVSTHYDLWLRYMLHSPDIMDAALTVWENGQERTKPEADRESAYMARNIDQTLKGLKVSVENFDTDADLHIMANLLLRAGDIKQAAALKPLVGLTGAAGVGAAEKFLKDIFAGSRLMDETFIMAAMEMTPQQISDLDDPFLNLAAEFYDAWTELREESRSRKGTLDQLQAEFLDVKQLFLEGVFVPDANGTLRFTFGRIEGYAPRDAVWMTPLTTVHGILEKNTGQARFNMPQRMLDLINSKDFGPLESKALGGVPVNMLYSTDTTGGNSGSPVLNAQGQIVGLNFDRAWEATINDFAWDHSYSRSIGVDIRYVLWVTWKYGGASRLLDEMNFFGSGAQE